jgi:hypothetical protein
LTLLDHTGGIEIFGKKGMTKQDERRVNMMTTMFLTEEGPVTMSIVKKEGSFREV